MGSMTGAPKLRVMKLMDQYEPSRRGLYSGSIGLIKPNGDFDLNVVIRTLIYNKTKQLLSFHVGGAITIQSSAEEEYEETLTKAASLLKHVKMIDYQNTLLAFLQENEIASSETFLMGISEG